jgi:hypothetical protein
VLSSIISQCEQHLGEDDIRRVTVRGTNELFAVGSECYYVLISLEVFERTKHCRDEASICVKWCHGCMVMAVVVLLLRTNRALLCKNASHRLLWAVCSVEWSGVRLLLLSRRQERLRQAYGFGRSRR